MGQSCRTSIVLIGALIMAACGGGSRDGFQPPVPPDDGTAPPLITTPVYTNLSFSQPTAMHQAPGDASRWFVAEKAGVIRVFANNPGSSSSSIFLDIADRVSAAGEGGLLGFAFHPDFPTTPEVYVSYTRGSPFRSFVSRFFSADGGETLEPGVEELILTISQPAQNHNGGNVLFGPDGLLYVGFGDGGGAGDPFGNGQTTSNLHGTIVRVDIDGGSPYAIPADNPFSANSVCVEGVGGADCPEIFAWGLRNPWRFSFDRQAGTLWAGDVGQGAWEEVDVIEAGNNYGWNVREGAHCFEPPSGCDMSGLTDPVSEYGRDLGVSVTGGYVYRGSDIPGLVGWYVFGDFGTGRLFAVRDDSTPVTAPEVVAETGLSIVTFAEGLDGELYVVDFGLGKIHKIDAAP